MAFVKFWERVSTLQRGGLNADLIGPGYKPGERLNPDLNPPKGPLRERLNLDFNPPFMTLLKLSFGKLIEVERDIAMFREIVNNQNDYSVDFWKHMTI